MSLNARDFTVEDRLGVAARYYAQEKAQGRPVSLQAGNARTRDQLTGMTREVLTDEGQLGRVLGEVTARVPVWLDATNRNDRSVYLPRSVRWRTGPISGGWRPRTAPLASFPERVFPRRPSPASSAKAASGRRPVRRATSATRYLSSMNPP